MSEQQDRQARLAAIRARLLIAVPAPWTPKSGGNDGVVRAIHFGSEVVVADCHGHEANTEFIANAREDVPYLLAENGRLSREVERLRGALSRALSNLSLARHRGIDALPDNYEFDRLLGELEDALEATRPAPGQ